MRPSRSSARAAALVGVLLAPVLQTGTAAAGVLPAPPPAATALSLSASPASVVHGRAVALSARLTRTADAAAVPGQVVAFLAAPAGTTAWTQVATAVTSATGLASAAWVPGRHVDVVATSAGSAQAAGSRSAVRRVTVAQSLVARLGAPAVRAGTTTTVHGTVSPAHPGRPVTLWRWSSGAWRVVATKALSATSTYSFGVTPTAPGWWHYRVTTPADADHGAATTRLPALDAYRLHTWSLTTRGTVVVDLATVAAAVAATYADARGWSKGHRRFARVASGGSFTVVMSQAAYLPSFSPVCSVRYSCRVGRYVILNQDRWRWGSSAFPGSLTQYRQMVVNHETGHWLGLGHQSCPRAGALAPVMQQQSIGMQGCAPNAWPLAAELARLP